MATSEERARRRDEFRGDSAAELARHEDRAVVELEELFDDTHVLDEVKAVVGQQVHALILSARRHARANPAAFAGVTSPEDFLALVTGTTAGPAAIGGGTGTADPEVLNTHLRELAGTFGMEPLPWLQAMTALVGPIMEQDPARNPRALILHLQLLAAARADNADNHLREDGTLHVHALLETAEENAASLGELTSLHGYLHRGGIGDDQRARLIATLERVAQGYPTPASAALFEEVGNALRGAGRRAHADAIVAGLSDSAKQALGYRT